MKKKVKSKGLLVLIVVGLLLCVLPKAWALNFTEDFTTDTYKDAETTTADWNTTDQEGKLHGYTEFRVNNYTDEWQSPSLIQGFSDDSFIIVWESGEDQDGSSAGVYAKMYNSDGSIKKDEFQVNDYTDSDQYPFLIQGFSDDSFIIVWYSKGQDGSGSGVYAKMYNSDGSIKKAEFQVNDYTDSDQYPFLIHGFSDDSFIIVWKSWDQDGSCWGVYAKMYNSDGSIKKAEFQVNDHTDNYQYPSLIHGFSDDSFIIVWGSHAQDGSGSGVYAKMYNSDGSIKKDEFQVNDYTASDQLPKLIQGFSDDSFIIVWGSYGQDGSEGGVYAKMYNADGTVKKDEFRVNDYTDSNQYPSLIQDFSDDSFIIVWWSLGQDGSNYGVYAKMYNSDGSIKKDEFQVNDYTYSNQYPYLIHGFSDDSFIIVWWSLGQDGSNYGVYAKMYNSDGSIKKDEFQVNDYTSNQSPKLIHGFSDDSFIIVWDSFYQDGSEDGVYAKMYNSDGTLITPKCYYTIHGVTLQSITISTEPVSGITLTADDNIPEGASITYYVTNSAGASICAQNSYNSDNREEYDCEMEVPSQYLGQSFVAEHDSFSKIGFQVDYLYVYTDPNNPDYGEIKIYATEDDLINDTNYLATAKLFPGRNDEEIEWGPGQEGNLFSVEFDSPVSVTIGETYYFALRPGDNTCIYLEGGYDSTENTYPDGKLYYSGGGIVGDLFFKVEHGIVWDEVTSGEYHAFSDPTGTDIRWKAVLGEATDPTQTPKINSVTIKSNQPPQASNLSISPASPKTTDNLVGSYDYYDADGDLESGTEIRWYKDDVLQPDYNDQLTIPSSATTKGEKWHFTVKPKDGIDFGELKTSLSVTIQNTVPKANDQSVTTNEDTAKSIALTGSDVDEDPITFIKVSDPSHGTLSDWNSNAGTTTYTPNLNYNGSDSFTFKANDGTADSNTAAVSLTINPVNDPPTITLFSPNGGELWKGTKDITWEASDVDGDILIISLDYKIGTGPWVSIATGEINDGTYGWDTTTAGGDSSAYYVRVLANDGTATGEDTSDGPFTIDNTPPTVIDITVTPDPTPALPAGGLEFKLIFSESMNTSIAPTVSYDPEGATGPQSCSSGSWSTTTNPHDTYTVYNDNEIDKTTGDGVAAISVSGAQDLAGNVMAPDTDDTFIINARLLVIQNAGASPLSFNPLEGEATTISYVLSESAVDVDITIIDQVTDLAVRNLVTDKPKDGGLNTIDWDGKNNEGIPVINPGEVKKYSATISAQSSIPGDQDEVKILNIEADSTIPVIRIISDDDPILRYLGYDTATISYETKAPGDNVTLNRNVKIWDSTGNVVYQTGFENEVEGSHTWTWDASDAATFPEGMYQYEILAKTLPPKPKSANSKKGIIVILDENNIEPPWSSGDGNVQVNSPQTGPTITITRLSPEEEPTDATKAILAADPSLYLESSMYNIIADPETDFVPPAILTFSYDPTLVGKEIADKLQIRYYDTATESWVPVERQYVDIVNHQIIAEIDHLSLLALFTCDDTTPPVVTITSPEAKEYYRTTDGEPTIIDITYTTEDPVVSGFSSGVVEEIVLLNDEEYEYAEIDLSTLVGENTLTVKAIDKAGNIGQASVKFTVVLVAQVTIKPEALKVTPGVLTAYIEFPEGYNVADIVDVTCDGALPESMMLNDDGTEMIIKFRRDAIEEALSQLDPPQTIDTEFKIRGTVQDASGTYIFEGTDTIMKVLEGSAPPEKGKGKGRNR